MNEDKTQEIKVSIPFLTEYVVGYRCWGFRFVRGGKGIRLESPMNDFVWPSYKPAKAKFTKPPCYNPNDTYNYVTWQMSASGLNAYKSEQDLRREYLHSSTPIFGAVALWGKVREFEKGYRAEYAYPLSLTLRVDIRETQLIENARLVPIYNICLNGNIKSLIAYDWNLVNAQERMRTANEQFKELNLGTLRYEIVITYEKRREFEEIKVDKQVVMKYYIRVARLLRSTYGTPVRLVNRFGGDLLVKFG